MERIRCGARVARAVGLAQREGARVARRPWSEIAARPVDAEVTDARAVREHAHVVVGAAVVRAGRPGERQVTADQEAESVCRRGGRLHVPQHRELRQVQRPQQEAVRRGGEAVLPTRRQRCARGPAESAPTGTLVGRGDEAVAGRAQEDVDRLVKVMDGLSAERPVRSHVHDLGRRRIAVRE